MGVGRSRLGLGDEVSVRRAVFLDRDGVLNRACVREGRPYPPADAEQLEILPGVADACAALRDAGFLLIVVTNQPDVARGQTSMEVVSTVNEALVAKISIDAVFVCPHDDEARCPCRKPAPGLILEAAHTWGINLPQSVMVGDRWRDVEAGRRAGCATVFVDAGYLERRPERPDFTAPDLLSAVPWIIERRAFIKGAAG